MNERNDEIIEDLDAATPEEISGGSAVGDALGAVRGTSRAAADGARETGNAVGTASGVTAARHQVKDATYRPLD